MSKVIIIGAGASGLVAAIYAAKYKNEVLLFERNASCGKKILITGNGRCNYWNENQEITNYHTNSEVSLEEIINEENQNKILKFFNEIGIIPKIKNGYLYPSSNQATSIKNALQLEAERRGVNIMTNKKIVDINKKENLFYVTTEENQFYTADKVVLATGGMAAPKTGSDGIGYTFAKKMGHTIISPLPALVKLHTNTSYLKELAGIRIDAIVSVKTKDNKIVKEMGELQLTKETISGICTMQISREVSLRLVKENEVPIKVNFIPGIATTIEEAKIWLQKQNRNVSNRTLAQLLEQVIHYKLVNTFLKLAKIKIEERVDIISKDKLDTLCTLLVNHTFIIDKTNSFDDAQVTTGGIDLKEIDLFTCESKLVKNLFFCGEILDVDGACGGYNLGFAWISGMLAGKKDEK